MTRPPGGPAAAGGDDGSPDPRLAAALTSYDGSPATRAEVLAALVGARVFLALSASATSTEVGESGLVQESSAQMALLSLASSSGARALPCFTDGHEVQRWRPEARPVPVPGPVACSSALDDGAVALLLDPTGVALVVEAVELAELAAGRVPVPGSALSARRLAGPVVGADSTAPGAPADTALLVALARALAGEPVVEARLVPADDGPVLALTPAEGSDLTSAPALLALAGRLRGRLGPALPAAGLDLALADAGGPGALVPLPDAPVPRRRWRPRR